MTILFLICSPLIWLASLCVVRYLVLALGILTGEKSVLNEICTDNIPGVEREIPTVRDTINFFKGK